MTAQLLDNGMDAVAGKINALRAKLLRLQEANGSVEDKKKLARRLQHWLATACRLLARQRAQIQDTMEAVEIDVRDGVIGEGSARDRSEASTNEYRRTYARPAAGSVLVDDADSAASYVAPQPEDILPRGCLVAAKVARSHELWILARVVRFDGAANVYEVEDVDSGEDDDDGSAPRRHHIVPWNQVVELPAGKLREGEWIQYAVNERVMAMYPNTTSFYRSTIRVPNPKVRPRILCLTRLMRPSLSLTLLLWGDSDVAARRARRS